MKNLLSLFTVVFCLSANVPLKAQDSLVSITLQARDVEFLAPKIVFNARFETLSDSIRAKFRRDTTLQGTSPVLLQNQSVQEIVNLLYDVKYLSFLDIPIAAQNRIVNAIGAITNTTVAAASTDADNRVNAVYAAMRKAGRKILLKQK